MVENEHPFGTPFELPRGFEEHNDKMRNLLKLQMPNIAKKIENRKPIIPDHNREARGICAMEFLENGLLPILRDEGSIDDESIYTTAQHFMDKAKARDPKNFDLTNVKDLIFISNSKISMVLFFASDRIKSNDKTQDWEKIINISRLANHVLTRALDLTL